MNTNEALVDLFVGIFNTAEAGKTETQITTAVSKAKDEVLVCSP